MPTRRTIAIDAVIAAVIACSVLAIAAIANSAKELYPTQWDRDKSVAYQFDGSVPEAFKDRVNAAAKQWTKLDASLSFKKENGTGNDYPDGQCGSHYQDDIVTVKNLGGPLGFTTWCLFDGTSEIYSFQFAIDKDVNWYTGKGNPPNDEYDLFSTAEHELGHAGGRSAHYPDGASECDKNPGEVMCATLGPGVSRKLQKHDKQTFEKAY